MKTMASTVWHSKLWVWITPSGVSELFLVGGCVKKEGGCDELKTEREGGLHARFLHLN